MGVMAQRKPVMDMLNFSIGSFQAKNCFAELLRCVGKGEVVTITKNGHAVAVMQSPRHKQLTDAQKAWQNMMSLSQEIAVQNASSPLTLADIALWKEDGRL